MLSWKGSTRIIESNFQPCTGPSIKLLTVSVMSWTEALDLKALMNIISRGFKFCSYLQTHSCGLFTVSMRWEHLRWREIPLDMLFVPIFAPEPLLWEGVRCPHVVTKLLRSSARREASASSQPWLSSLWTGPMEPLCPLRLLLPPLHPEKGDLGWPRPCLPFFPSQTDKSNGRFNMFCTFAQCN